jgi:uncharacterized protein YjbI with pentapeptide repeats
MSPRYQNTASIIDADGLSPLFLVCLTPLQPFSAVFSCFQLFSAVFTPADFTPADFTPADFTPAVFTSAVSFEIFMQLKMASC